MQDSVARFGSDTTMKHAAKQPVIRALKHILSRFHASFHCKESTTRKTPALAIEVCSTPATYLSAKLGA